MQSKVLRYPSFQVKGFIMLNPRKGLIIHNLKLKVSLSINQSIRKNNS